MEVSEFRYEFYNGGLAHSEIMKFSISETSAGFNFGTQGKDSTGFWPLNMPKEGFFTVPSEIISGTEVKRVYFADDIKRRFGKQGVVLIDAKHNPETEDPDAEVSEYPIARTKEDAVKRGDEIWKLHLRRVVEGHLNDCQNAMAAGGAPRAASGFTKKAFKLLGVADPGEGYFMGLKEQGKVMAQAGTTEAMLRMEQQTQTMLAVMVALASGQKVDPEILKTLAPKPIVQPVMSGIATGEVKKPVGEFDPKKAGLDRDDVVVRSKSSRAADAAKELART